MYTTMSLALSILACGSPDTGKETDRSRHSEGASDHDAIDTGDDHDTGAGSAHDDDTGHVPSPSVDVAVVVVEVSDDADWRDLSFLAAIPASAHLNGGMPAVVAISVEGSPKVGTRDFLSRLDPAQMVHPFGLDIETEAERISVAGADAKEWSLGLAELGWESADYAVVVSATDYSAAVIGSSVAALMNAPMIVVGADTVAAENRATALGAEIVSIGVEAPPPELVGAYTAVDGVDEVMAWVEERGRSIDYLAVTNVNDRASGRSQKASMVASMYTAHRGGLTIPIAIEMPTDVVSDGGDHPVLPLLADVYASLGRPPRHLAIVGAHDALPQMRKPTIFDNPLSEQPVSDLPYGQTDEDPFVDIAIGRIIGDTPEELSVIASRTAQYDRLKDGTWEDRIVEAGLWGFDELRAVNTNAQFRAAVHLSESEIETAGTLDVGAFLHKDHSYCQVLGHAVDVSTPTLFAPAITVSRGCSVGGMDLLRDDQRSIVDHLFGQGIVAFVGAARNAIAYNTIIEVSLWHQLLDGQTLGEAFRHGVNDAIVHWLDDSSAAMRYAIDTEIVYGDPAFRLHVPGPFLTAPARQVFDGSTLTVHAPELWTVVPYHPEMLAEWGYGGDLYMYTAPGAIPRTYWAGAYDNEDMYFGVQLHLEDAPSTVTQIGSYPSPLGWGGEVHLDHHHDGSTSALWRVRLLDFDPTTGALVNDAPSFSYSVE